MSPEFTIKPLIGLTCRWDEERGVFDLPAEYAQAVAAAGGVPVLIPLIPDLAAEFAARLDGIILSGSPSDVDPVHYGQPAHSSVTKIYAALDATNFQLCEHADAAGKPLLGICFGVQALNVFRGGSLIQHIPDAISGAIIHQNREGSHRVEITAGSCLAQWAGSLTAAVNSTHHQAIDRVGKGLRVSARAPDGVIESVEGETPGRFLIGVQWHPERIWREHALSARLFQELVQAAIQQRSMPRV